MYSSLKGPKSAIQIQSDNSTFGKKKYERWLQNHIQKNQFDVIFFVDAWILFLLFCQIGRNIFSPFNILVFVVS